MGANSISRVRLCRSGARGAALAAVVATRYEHNDHVVAGLQAMAPGPTSSTMLAASWPDMLGSLQGRNFSIVGRADCVMYQHFVLRFLTTFRNLIVMNDAMADLKVNPDAASELDMVAGRCQPLGEFDVCSEWPTTPPEATDLPDQLGDVDHDRLAAPRGIAIWMLVSALGWLLGLWLAFK
jgi:hypothetical protein